MAPPVPGKAPAKKQRSTARQPLVRRPPRNVVPDSVDFRDRPYRPAVAFAPRPIAEGAQRLERLPKTAFLERAQAVEELKVWLERAEKLRK